MKRLLLISAALLSLSTTARADITGNDLYLECSATNNLPMQLTCMHFLTGVFGALFMWQTAAPNTTNFCVPESSSGLQYRDIFVRYMKKHPEKRSLSAAFAVGLSFQDAWPHACSED